jgi:hypothetical protein
MKVVKSLFVLARSVLRKKGKVVFLFPAKKKASLEGYFKGDDF